jgi:hypothetical protein
VKEYALCKDVVSALKKPNMDPKQFNHHPLLVMNNFNGDEMHMKLMSTMFQNMFPSININKVCLLATRENFLVHVHPAAITITGDRAGNLDLCLALNSETFVGIVRNLHIWNSFLGEFEQHKEMCNVELQQ